MMMPIQEEVRREAQVTLRQVADVVRLLHKGLMSPHTLALSLLGEAPPVDSSDPVAVLDGFIALAGSGGVTMQRVEEFLDFYLKLEEQSRLVRSLTLTDKA